MPTPDMTAIPIPTHTPFGIGLIDWSVMKVLNLSHAVGSVTTSTDGSVGVGGGGEGGAIALSDSIHTRRSVSLVNGILDDVALGGIVMRLGDPFGFIEGLSSSCSTMIRPF